MARHHHHFFFLLLFTLLRAGVTAAVRIVDVGVVLDVEGTWLGKVGWSCVSMAVDDFYAAHPNYTTRLSLHLRDSNDSAVGAASSALDLLNNVKVHAIIGPQRSGQAKFLMELGSRTHVPVISFSATSPSISSASTEFFVRTALNDNSQANCIASLVKSFNWRQVVPVFEDSEYGSGIIPCLVDALQENDIRVPCRAAIPVSATQEQIREELDKLKAIQARVFVVHMTRPLGLKFFRNAKHAGMLEEGYVWITTNELTDIVDVIGSTANDLMKGVLGVRPYVSESKDSRKFKLRWRKEFHKNYPRSNASDPSAYGLWAYDMAWALAEAVEGIKSMPDFRTAKVPNGSSFLANLSSSKIGPQIMKSVANTNFHGLSGKFHVVRGQLQTSTFEIINVRGEGTKRVGFWTPKHGISGHKSSKARLDCIMWPGRDNRITTPMGWKWPTGNKKLRIGVPVKFGFSEFVDVQRDRITNRSTGNYSGFCIRVFEAVMRDGALPYRVPYEYILYEDSHGLSNGTYDDLIYQVYSQKFDAVVGDITIRANRSLYVDFTHPYLESGVSMLVPVKDGNSKSTWTFLKPLTTDLWVAILVLCLSTGSIVWVFEHRINDEFRGPPARQLGTVFYVSFSTIVFAHREKLKSNCSRFVVVIWMFVMLILTSSYTASLSSLLTVQRLQPTIQDLKELTRRGNNVGYSNNSFVPGLLKKMNFDISKLIPYNSPEDYADALSKGSSNGGVDAIIDEVPYIKIFLSRYPDKYAMVGPTYKADGFGFAFPKGSPLVPFVSRAILNFTETNRYLDLEKKLYGEQIRPDKGNDAASTSLKLSSFWGLFLITGLTSICALAIFSGLFVYENRHNFKNLSSESSMWRKIVFVFKLFDQKSSSSGGSTDDTEPTFQNANEIFYSCNDYPSPASFSNHTYENSDQEEDTGTPINDEGTRAMG